MKVPSNRPYIIRALHEWCSDNGFTPYLSVFVDASVAVPLQFVQKDEIVLNISYESTNALSLGNDFISFQGRFNGKVEDVMVPVSHVLGIYAKENGQGMAFHFEGGLPPPMSEKTLQKDTDKPGSEAEKNSNNTSTNKTASKATVLRPVFKRVK